MPKVRWVVRTARLIGQLAHVRSRSLRWLRDLAMRTTPAWVNEMQFNRLYALNF